MVRNRLDPRDGEVWIDCAQTRAAYNELKVSDRPRFESLRQKMDGGGLSRLLGTAGAQGREPKRFGRILKRNVQIFAEESGYPIQRFLVEGTGLMAPPNALASDVDFHSGQKRNSEPELILLPLAETNAVFLGTRKSEDNAPFRFSAAFNMVSKSAPCVLTGFRATYIAPDGCYCANLEPEIRIGTVHAVFAANSVSLVNAISVLPHSAVQLEYWRKIYPPLIIQAPIDCDYGDLHVEYTFYCEEREIQVTRYFSFEPGGRLALVENKRDVPILSDSMVERMRADGVIDEDEYDRLVHMRDIDRYRIVRFSNYRLPQIMDPEGGYTREVTDQDRQFLEAIHSRYRRHYLLISPDDASLR